jgi:hypothetical protein
LVEHWVGVDVDVEAWWWEEGEREREIVREICSLMALIESTILFDMYLS